MVVLVTQLLISLRKKLKKKRKKIVTNFKICRPAVLLSPNKIAFYSSVHNCSSWVAIIVFAIRPKLKMQWVKQLLFFRHSFADFILLHSQFVSLETDFNAFLMNKIGLRFFSFLMQKTPGLYLDKKLICITIQMHQKVISSHIRCY